MMVITSAACIEAQTTLSRFNTMARTTQYNNVVKINVFAMPVTKPKDEQVVKTVFDLTDRGQEALLNNKSIAESKELLNSKFQEKPQQQDKIIDLTKRQIRLIFSVSRTPDYSKKTFSAYDRVEDLRYTVKLDTSIVNNSVKFKSWNRFNTEYGTLDIGTLEFNQSFNASLDVTGTIGASVSGSSTAKKDEENSTTNGYSFGPSVSATGKLGYNKSRKENQSIKQRFIQLTGSINEKEFSIHQQGTRETELAGNSSIDLEIELPKDVEFFATFKSLFKADGTPVAPANIGFSTNRYYIPDANLIRSEGVMAKLDYNYVIRHIKKKANTFPEYDDRVSFIIGKDSMYVTLIDKKSLLQPMYYISFEDSLNLTYDGCKRAVYFLSFEEASEFKTWLVQQIPTLASDLTLTSQKLIFCKGTIMYSLSDSTVKNNLGQIKIDVVQ